MKKILTAMFFLILLWSIIFCLNAQAIELQTQYFKQTSRSKEFGQTDGLKLKAFLNNKSILYAWGSFENSEFALVEQSMPSVQIYGIGFGVRKRMKDLEFYMDMGWYHPESSSFGNKLITGPGATGDRVDIYLNSKYSTTYGRRHFDYYKLNITGNLGGSVGVAYRLPINKHLNMVVGASYRVLTLPMEGRGENYNDNAIWCTKDQLDLSGPAISVGFIIEF